MRLFYSIMIFGVAIQIAAFLLMAFQVDPNIQYPVALSPGIWDINVFSIMFAGVGGSVIMLAGLLLRQGTYAIYATLIWVIGMLISPIKNFFIAIPNTIFGIFTPIFNGMNPTPTVENPIITVLVYIVTFAAFWFLVELVTQRAMN
jgi:hypothetical protein